MNFLRSTLLLLALAVVTSAQADETAPPNGVANFHAPKDVVELVPRQTLMQLKIASQMEAAKTTANTTLADNALNKWATFKVKVVKWIPWDSPGVIPNKFRVDTQEQMLNVNGVAIGVRIMVYLGADAEPIVTKLAKGQEITVTSFLNRVDFTTNKGEGTKLNFDLTRTKIEPK